MTGACPTCGRVADPLPMLLRVPDMASALGISEEDVRRRLRRGELPGRKVGGSWECWRGELLDVVDRRTGEAEVRLPRVVRPKGGASGRARPSPSRT